MRLKRLSLFVFVLSLLSVGVQAQTRYQDSVFAGYTLDSVTYSSVYGFKMDIYQPAGDTVTSRPVLVLAHGGSFLTTGGNREGDPTINNLCPYFAKRGYVTISIDYTLTSVLGLSVADSAIIEVLRAVSDGKAAVRYVHEYADSLGIDTNNIFIGGSSAGAVLSMQYAYIDSLNQLNSNYQALVAQVGGLDGNSGNPGYSSNFKAVINLAGALGDPSWLSYCSKPVVSAQGTADNVVPYTCGNPYGIIPVTLCGLGTLQPYIASNTPYWSSVTFPGAGHVPWQSSTTEMYTVDTLINNFLYMALSQSPNATCTGTPYTGLNNVTAGSRISIFPNPASGVLNIQSDEYITSIAMTDETGRIVAQTNNLNTLSYQLSTSGLSAGIYIVRINDSEGLGPTIKKIIIE